MYYLKSAVILSFEKTYFTPRMIDIALWVVPIGFVASMIVLFILLNIVYYKNEHDDDDDEDFDSDYLITQL